MVMLHQLIFLATFFALGSLSIANPADRAGEKSPPDPEPFPVTIDFHCVRNFGFHIGDEIPLTVMLEAKKGSIIDLVNLPKEKETHGSFEIRDLKVRECRKSDRTVYTVDYRLQSFEPAIAVDRVSFPPLRISYATKENWNPKESKYHYQSLYAQPFEVFVSRIATYIGPMKDIKGPIKDKKALIGWKVTAILGSLMVFLPFIAWLLEFIRKRRRVVSKSTNLSAPDRALKALQQARENCFNYDDHRKRLFFEVNAILRDFLKDACGLNVPNRSSLEIIDQLKDCPFYKELKGLVDKINQVIYEGAPPVDVESIVKQFSMLLEKIDEQTPQGVSHDKAS